MKTNKTYEAQRLNLMLWHQKQGHKSRKWKAIKLPEDVVDWLQHYPSTSPTEYIISKISRDGFRESIKAEDSRQLDLFRSVNNE